MASVSRRVRRAVCRGPSTVKVLRKRWARYRQKHEIPVSLGGLRGPQGRKHGDNRDRPAKPSRGRMLCPDGFVRPIIKPRRAAGG